MDLRVQNETRSAKAADKTNAMIPPKATKMGLSPLFHFAFFKKGKAPGFALLFSCHKASNWCERVW